MSFRPPHIEALRQEAREFSDRKLNAGLSGERFDTRKHQLLQTHPVNRFMESELATPLPRMLFGSLWFEHELCILFADTNLGKSVLAVQIADALSKAYTVEPFYNKMDECATVLYVDFELTAKQFQIRYYDGTFGAHPFSDRFYRSQFNPDGDNSLFYGEKYDEYVAEALRSAVESTGATVLIIDNITYMCRGTDRSADAVAFMKMLKALKRRYRLSVLVLAHTPKRSQQTPITVNHLQGSKMLINFADSAFAIGQSAASPHVRYIKQIKQRSSAQQYGAENICLVTLQKTDGFLHYRLLKYDHEYRHLHQPTTQERLQRNAEVAALHSQGLTNRQIGKQLGIHHTTVARCLETPEV